MNKYKDIGHSPEQLEALRQLAVRVASGSQLQSSPKLREFFQYVIDCAFRNAPDEATEQQIGVHVFHRHPGYNSGDDSIVRSQARLLRSKLAAYFADEGAHEPIIIEIPKGQYLPIFRAAKADATPSDTAVGDTVPTAPSPASIEAPSSEKEQMTSVGEAPAKTRTPSISYAQMAAVLFLVGLLVWGAWYLRRGHVESPSEQHLDAFWGPFYHSTDTLVIFSNPAFIGNPTDGLRLAPLSRLEGQDPSDEGPLDETYTGVGEAAAIQRLTQLFDAHHASFMLKRSRLVTWDEARNYNLIFVGAPSQNTALNDLPKLTQFKIEENPTHHGYIVNLHPKPGEPATFPLISNTEEDAIVAVMPGLQPNTRIAIFSGLSTIGTQEAVEFFCRPETIQLLLDQQHLSKGPVLPFEAVIEIQVRRSVGIGASFLSMHLEPAADRAIH